MAGRILKRPQARIDLIEHATHIGEDSRLAADRFIESAENAFQKLLQFPHLGSPRELRDPDYSGLRMWPIPGFRNHLIFYRPTEDGVEIIRVLHAARDQVRIFGE